MTEAERKAYAKGWAEALWMAAGVAIGHRLDKPLNAEEERQSETARNIACAILELRPGDVVKTAARAEAERMEREG